MSVCVSLSLYLPMCVLMLSRCAATVGCKTQSYCHNIVASCVCVCYLLSLSLHLITKLIESQHMDARPHTHVLSETTHGLTCELYLVSFFSFFFFSPCRSRMSYSRSVCSSVMEDLG